MRVDQFLLHDRLQAEIAARAAEFLGQVEAEQARVPGLVPEFAVHLVLAAPALAVGHDLLAEELRRVLAQFAMLIGFPGGAVVGEEFGHRCALYFPMGGR